MQPSEGPCRPVTEAEVLLLQPLQAAGSSSPVPEAASLSDSDADGADFRDAGPLYPEPSSPPTPTDNKRASVRVSDIKRQMQRPSAQPATDPFYLVWSSAQTHSFPSIPITHSRKSTQPATEARTSLLTTKLLLPTETPTAQNCTRITPFNPSRTLVRTPSPKLQRTKPVFDQRELSKADSAVDGLSAITLGFTSPSLTIYSLPEAPSTPQSTKTDSTHYSPSSTTSLSSNESSPRSPSYQGITRLLPPPRIASQENEITSILETLSETSDAGEGSEMKRLSAIKPAKGDAESKSSKFLAKNVRSSPLNLAKPLPSTPVARVQTDSPTQSGRTLLDAAVHPLRSETNALDKSEWPPLKPTKMSVVSEDIFGANQGESSPLGSSKIPKPSINTKGGVAFNFSRMEGGGIHGTQRQALPRHGAETLSNQDRLSENPRVKSKTSLSTSDTKTPSTSQTKFSSTFSKRINLSRLNSPDLKRSHSDATVKLVSTSTARIAPPVSPASSGLPRPIRQLPKHRDVVEAAKAFSDTSRPRTAPTGSSPSINFSRMPSRITTQSQASRHVFLGQSKLPIPPSQNHKFNTPTSNVSDVRSCSPSGRNAFDTSHVLKRQSNPPAPSLAEFGPTLKIFPDAEKLIMGDDDQAQRLSTEDSSPKNLDRLYSLADASDQRPSSLPQIPRPASSDSDKTIVESAPKMLITTLEGPKRKSYNGLLSPLALPSLIEESPTRQSNGIQSPISQTKPESRTHSAQSLGNFTSSGMVRSPTGSLSRPDPTQSRVISPTPSGISSRYTSSRLPPNFSIPRRNSSLNLSAGMISPTPTLRPATADARLLNFAREGRSLARSASTTSFGGAKTRRPPSRTRRAMTRIGNLFHKNEQVPPVPSIPLQHKAATYHHSSIGHSILPPSTVFLPQSKTSQFSVSSFRGNIDSPTTMDPTVVREITKATSELIDKARNMPDGMEKERMLHISSILVNAVSSAHGAYKAKLEAQRAADQACLSFQLMQRSLEELTNIMGRQGTISSVLSAQPDNYEHLNEC